MRNTKQASFVEKQTNGLSSWLTRASVVKGHRGDAINFSVGGNLLSVQSSLIVSSISVSPRGP